MSSTSSPTSPSSQPPPAPKSAPPVSIQPTQLAQTYATIHPLLLLTLLAARFDAFVADPVAELTSDLPLLAILQVAYMTICLPPAGDDPHHADDKDRESKKSSTAGGMVLRPGKPGYRRRANTGTPGRGGIMSKVVPSLLSLTLTTLLATPVLALCLVLFGAPVTTHHAETALCAAHMAVLAATALIYTHGVDGPVWKEVWGVFRPGDAVWGAALGTCVGAWLGAVPIPLDWDRPWQAYPITILTGAYIGHGVGSLLGRTLLFGKRIALAPSFQG
ncbi:GPI biosynthesis protein Pig-F [Aspergillus ambiguus]|uniref:PIG-F family protein n=1 Tax=Aspergillus ambiguus TaxID=176160 RepID=UPI003CCCE47C